MIFFNGSCEFLDLLFSTLKKFQVHVCVCVCVIFFYIDKSKSSVCLKNISLEGLHWLLATRLVHYLPFRWSCHLMLDSREKKNLCWNFRWKDAKKSFW